MVTSERLCYYLRGSFVPEPYATLMLTHDEQRLLPGKVHDPNA